MSADKKPPMTEPGTLEYGVEYEGVLHYDFVMRLTTVNDNIEALERTGAASGLRITLDMYANALVSLGTIPKEAITPVFLASALADSDYDVLAAAQERLKKKRKRSSARSAGTGSPSSPSASTASTPPQSEA